MSRLDFTLKMIEEHPEVFEWNYPKDNPASYVHPSVEVPLWVEIGKGVIIHEGVKLGTQGFGYELNPKTGELLHIPHIGKLIIEDGVEILENTVLCRGTVGDTVIGKGTKIDVLNHVPHNTKIGKNCMFAGGCCLGGSSEIGDNVFLGTGTTTRDHSKIANGVFIGCGSNVVKDITVENSIWAGNPAKFVSKKPWLKGVSADVHPTVKFGKNTFVWSFAVICEGVEIGDNCVVGSGAYVGKGCKIGNNVRIQHGAFIVDHMNIQDNVFIGPCVVTTNDKYPVVNNPDYENLPPILEYGCSLGANCTILPGVRIGHHAMIGAGSVVTKDVEPNVIVVGTQAKGMNEQ